MFADMVMVMVCLQGGLPPKEGRVCLQGKGSASRGVCFQRRESASGEYAPRGFCLQGGGFFLQVVCLKRVGSASGGYASRWGLPRGGLLECTIVVVVVVC